jgi:DNA excision repair protein ERCC-4
MQTYILELMNMTVKELKRINKTVELQEITVENCLTKKFQKNLQMQLDGIWNQLSDKSRQLVADLKTLRHLIMYLGCKKIVITASLRRYEFQIYALLRSDNVLFNSVELSHDGIRPNCHLGVVGTRRNALLPSKHPNFHRRQRYNLFLKS